MPNNYDLSLDNRVSNRSSVYFNGMLHTLSVLIILFTTQPSAVSAAEDTASRKIVKEEMVDNSQDQSSLNSRIKGLEGANEHIDKSVKDLQVQVEETTVQLYESRTKGIEHFKKLEEAINQINQYLASSLKHQASGAGVSGISHVPTPSDINQKDGLTSSSQATSALAVETADYTPSTPKASAPLAMSSYAAPLEAMLAAVLVFLAPLGFSFIEAARAEHSTVPRIFLRNLLVTAIMLMTFATLGSWISYGQSLLTSISSIGSELAPNGESNDTFWLFHLQLTIMVGLVANTILSDRISLSGHILMASLLGLVLHPLMGRLVWMGHWLPSNPGWLEGLGFLDFAGATAIHSAGAWFALAWLWRFPAVRSSSDGNPAYALLALFILWLNWFGLAMGYQHSDIQLIALPIINVSLAGATAILLSFLMSLKQIKTSDQTDMSLIYFRLATGVLGGLVAISAGVDRFTPIEAIVVSGFAGVLHNLAYRWLNTLFLKDDHTATALIATHGICGVWGTLCLGFMGSAGSFTLPEVKQLGIQGLGIVMTFGLGSLVGLLGAVPYQLFSRPKVATASTPGYENFNGGSSLAQELSVRPIEPVTTSAPSVEIDDLPTPPVDTSATMSEASAVTTSPSFSSSETTSSYSSSSSETPSSYSSSSSSSSSSGTTSTQHQDTTF